LKKEEEIRQLQKVKLKKRVYSYAESEKFFNLSGSTSSSDGQTPAPAQFPKLSAEEVQEIAEGYVDKADQLAAIVPSVSPKSGSVVGSPATTRTISDDEDIDDDEEYDEMLSLIGSVEKIAPG
jgi:hypothetical protein